MPEKSKMASFKFMSSEGKIKNCCSATLPKRTNLNKGPYVAALSSEKLESFRAVKSSGYNLAISRARFSLQYGEKPTIQILHDINAIGKLISA
jgi:hypothetical protein